MNLSICIPTFRRADMLRQLLESIQKNKLQADIFEVIIVDSGLSFDNTEKVVQSFQELPISYIKKEMDDGLDRVVKEMLSIAKGKFTWFISDDDIVLDDSLSHINTLINSNNKLGGLVLNYKAFTSDLSHTFPPHDAFNGERLNALTYFDNCSELFKRVGLHMGYLSCLIIDTAHAKEILSNKNIDIPENLWGHTIIAGYISKINPNWIYSDFAGVGYRADSDSILKSIGIIERQKVTHKNFFDVITLIFGSHSAEERTIRKQLISKRVPRSILNMKTKDFSVRDQYKVFRLMLRYYYSYVAFWFLVLPSFLVPGFILSPIKGIYLKIFANKTK